jgi:hypothetical protein
MSEASFTPGDEVHIFGPVWQLPKREISLLGIWHGDLKAEVVTVCQDEVNKMPNGNLQCKSRHGHLFFVHAKQAVKL